MRIDIRSVETNSSRPSS